MIYVDYSSLSVTIVHLALLGFWNLYNMQIMFIPQLVKIFRRIVRNPKVFLPLPRLVPILSQINPVHAAILLLSDPF